MNILEYHTLHKKGIKSQAKIRVVKEKEHGERKKKRDVKKRRGVRELNSTV